MIIRKQDQLGRVVIPKEWRDELGITNNTLIAIRKKGNKIELSKYEESCCVCGELYESGMEVNDNKICWECYKKIKSI